MNAILRPADARGHANFGWLDTHHSFSFGQYHDPRHMGFRSLRVINDDRIAAGAGFPRHPHRDMEIISYVVSGALSHQDSLGTRRTLHRGDVQVMTAGTGIEHSEFNGGADPVHLLQIWIIPPARNLPPAYADYTVPETAKHNALAYIAGPASTGAIAPVHQDARLYASLLEAGHSVSHETDPSRGVWLQMVSGTLSANGTGLKAGDGLAVEAVDRLVITADSDSEFLLFDLA